MSHHLAYISHRLDKIIVEAPRNPNWAAAINYVIPSTDRISKDGVWIFRDKWYPAVLDITSYYFPHFTDIVNNPPRSQPALENLKWKERWAQFLLDRHIKPNKKTSYYDIDALQFKVTRGPHSVLYLKSNAPREVVIAAYRALSKIHHPDRRGGDAARFKTIQKAYEEIINDD